MAAQKKTKKKSAKKSANKSAKKSGAKKAMPAKKPKTHKKATKKKGTKKKGRAKRPAVAKTPTPPKTSLKKPVQRSSPPPPRVLERKRSHPGGDEAGDLQGLSRREVSDSESVEELLEEGNAFEAGAVSGVEAAENADEGEVHTHEVPTDDVPDEYLDEK